jgi:hypothetical protein
MVFKKFLICPPELFGKYLQIHLVAKQEKLGDEMAVEFCLRSVFFIL